MKKVFITTITIICAFAMTANAQIYVGGLANFSTDSKVKGTNKQFAFSFEPEIGYHISDKWEAGMILQYNFDKVFDQDDRNIWDKETLWEIWANVRYKFAELGSFSVWLEGYAGVGNEKVSKKITGVETTYKDEMCLDLGFYPNLTYSVTDHLKLHLYMVFFNVAYSFYNGGDNDNEFSFNINTNDATIGFTYQF